MRRIRTHRMGVDQGSRMLFSDFKHDGVMWTGEGDRELRHTVTFSEPFSSAPVVMLSLSMLDVANDANNRLDISADAVTPNGFDIVFRTWGDTKIARARADWTAMGEVAHEDDWDLT